MKLIFTSALVFFFSSSLFALESQNYRIVRNNKKVEIHIDGNFPDPGMTDVLFVIDDSGSMNEHQKRLKQHASILANKAEQSKGLFNIGVTSTSTESFGNSYNVGELRGNPKIINQNTPNLVSALENNFVLGTNGSPTESFFTPVMAALTEPLLSTSNKGFYRESARLSLVVLTDTEDQGNVSTWEFANFLMSLKQNNMSQISVEAIIVPSNLNDPSCQGENMDALKIEELVRIFDGHTYSLCSETYTENMETMADQIFSSGHIEDYKPGDKIDSIELLGSPKLNTVEVRFGNQKIPKDPKKGWWLSGNQPIRLIFSEDIAWEPQGLETPIVISYEIN